MNPELKLSMREWAVLDGNWKLIKRGKWEEIETVYDEIKKGFLVEILEEK
jgi:hypothetical protein